MKFFSKRNVNSIWATWYKIMVRDDGLHVFRMIKFWSDWTKLSSEHGLILFSRPGCRLHLAPIDTIKIPYPLQCVTSETGNDVDKATMAFPCNYSLEYLTNWLKLVCCRVKVLGVILEIAKILWYKLRTIIFTHI